MSVEHNYHIESTGRVKAAGVPMDHVFSPAKYFRNTTSIAGAQQVTEAFFMLRNAPPDEIRDRFFPRGRANKSMFRNGSLLLRPILKTDQGAGQFLPFDMGEVEEQTLRYNIAYEEGFCVPETFFERQLREKGHPRKVMCALDDVARQFRRLDIREAQLAYERLQVACEEEGITYQREVQVGREALFFIRPAVAQQTIRVPHIAQRSIQEVIRQQVETFSEKAQEARRQFAREHNLPMRTKSVRLPLYFQADVQLLPSGKAVVDQVQLPDVGLFLTTLTADGHLPLREVQQRVEPLVEAVSDSIASLGRESRLERIFLVTRPEVLENEEDLLEMRELQVLTDTLRERGFKAHAISVAQALDLQSEDTALLLNVDSNTQTFHELLKKDLVGGGCTFFPDPFLLLKLQEMTNYQRVCLGLDQIEILKAIVKEVEVRANGAAEKQLLQLLALDNYVTRLGLSEDVFHIYTSSQPTPVACFRYDAKGFQIALSYIKPGDHVEIRSVPIDPDRAVLFNAQGRPMYSVFRIMAVRENI